MSGLSISADVSGICDSLGARFTFSPDSIFNTRLIRPHTRHVISSLQKILYSVCIIVFLSGCGVVLKGTTQDIHFKVSPEGSTVNVDGKDFYNPEVISLGRNSSYIATISKEGYEPTQVKIEKKISGGIVLLDLLTSVTLLPLLIDAATGAWYNLKPEQVTVTLRSNQTGAVNIPVILSLKDDNLKIVSSKPVHVQIRKE